MLQGSARYLLPWARLAVRQPGLPPQKSLERVPDPRPPDDDLGWLSLSATDDDAQSAEDKVCWLALLSRSESRDAELPPLDRLM